MLNKIISAVSNCIKSDTFYHIKNNTEIHEIWLQISNIKFQINISVLYKMRTNVNA